MNKIFCIALFILFPLVSGAQTRVTRDEAEQAADVACQPDDSGLLACVPVPVPPPPLTNDPSIQPLPGIPLSMESFSNTTINRPNIPGFDPIPATSDTGSVEIGWDLNYGIPVQYWEIWDNGQLRYRGRQFTQRAIASNSGLEGPAFSVRTLSMQSGIYTLTLVPGRHELTVNLCSGGARSEPLCARHEAVTWVGGEDKSSPGKPQLESLPSVNTGEPLEVRWNVWWGQPGQYWQLLDNDAVIYESRKFSPSERAVQSGSLRIQSPSPEAHDLRVNLCSANVCVASDSTRVSVLLPGPRPPTLQVQSSLTPQGEWLVSWRLPYSYGTGPPDSWQLRNPAADQVLVAKQSVSQCPAVSSKDQEDVFAGYCGDALLPAVNAPAATMVRVCTGTDCFDSRSVPLVRRATNRPRSSPGQ
ncbi:chitinase N-terminal domain-containing protein [Variovorax rhizosphaerae]|uniref:Chitinase N-terminal domain-containing protein n=1 Tax=Variovorax rhizosphaerae TaxID=1836200 RepID=A0ABU8WVT1_9BURK